MDCNNLIPIYFELPDNNFVKNNTALIRNIPFFYTLSTTYEYTFTLC